MPSAQDLILEHVKNVGNEPLPDGHSEIQQFYAGKTILLTGATGFMGKCLLEKLLRGCPDIERIYIVVRPKPGVPLQEKTNKLFKNLLFDRLRQQNPRFADKVAVIKGDLQEDRLGISEADRQRFINEVDLIIHNGATVKFNEKVSVALRINVLSTKYMLDLAMECKHLKAFMYVSTAFSHCYRKDIEEKFYPSPADLKMIGDMMAADEASEEAGLSDDTIRMMLGDWTNIYTFTKSIAEDLVRQYGEKANFGCAVYRPSVVTAAYEEPIPGWLGNNNGPGSPFMGAGLGAVHACYYLDTPMDLVPADFSINALIAAIYDVTYQWNIEKRPLVYNFGSALIHPIHIDVLFDQLLDVISRIGSTNLLWFPWFYFTKSLIIFWILNIFFHFIPAVLADLALLIMKKKPRALSIFFMGSKYANAIFYFLNGNWRIDSSRTMDVYDRLGPLDRRLFNYDLRKFDQSKFIWRYATFVRTYVFKESLENLEPAQRRYRQFKYAHYTSITIFSLLLLYYAYRIFICLYSRLF